MPTKPSFWSLAIPLIALLTVMPLIKYACMVWCNQVKLPIACLLPFSAVFYFCSHKYRRPFGEQPDLARSPLAMLPVWNISPMSYELMGTRPQPLLPWVLFSSQESNAAILSHSFSFPGTETDLQPEPGDEGERIKDIPLRSAQNMYLMVLR